MPRCIISDGDPNLLIQQMYEYMQVVSSKSYEIMQQRFERVLTELSRQISARESLVAESLAARANGEGDKAVSLEAKSYRMKIFDKQFANLHVWLRRLVCLGFNTGNFDLNLTRQYLFPYLVRSGLKIEYIIKKTMTICQFLHQIASFWT